MRKLAWIFAITIFCLLVLRGFLTGRERSHRIHETLQSANSYELADEKIRAALEQAVNRTTRSFSEFQKQCADLKVALSENDQMEKRKRKMLAELRTDFPEDSKVQPIISTLGQMEDLSDRAEAIWRGMIACSDQLASANEAQQDAYGVTCVVPAHQQLELLAPEIRGLGAQLQAQIQENGGSLPPDLLSSLGK